MALTNKTLRGKYPVRVLLATMKGSHDHFEIVKTEMP